MRQTNDGTAEAPFRTEPGGPRAQAIGKSGAPSCLPAPAALRVQDGHRAVGRAVRPGARHVVAGTPQAPHSVCRARPCVRDATNRHPRHTFKFVPLGRGAYTKLGRITQRGNDGKDEDLQHHLGAVS